MALQVAVSTHDSTRNPREDGKGRSCLRSGKLWVGGEREGGGVVRV